MYVGALDYNPEYVGKDVGGTLPKRDTSSCFSAAKERISLSFNPYQYHLMVFYLLNYRQINHTCKKNSLKNKARLVIIPITHDFDRFRKGNKIFKTPQVFIWAVRLNMQRPLGTELCWSRERLWVRRDRWLRGDVGQTAGQSHPGVNEGEGGQASTDRKQTFSPHSQSLSGLSPCFRVTHNDKAHGSSLRIRFEHRPNREFLQRR